MFGAGTAVIVSPVEGINYKGTQYKVPIDSKMHAGPLTYELFNQMLDIQ